MPLLIVCDAGCVAIDGGAQTVTDLGEHFVDRLGGSFESFCVGNECQWFVTLDAELLSGWVHCAAMPATGWVWVLGHGGSFPLFIVTDV